MPASAAACASVNADADESIADSELIVVLTEWDEFKSIKTNKKIIDTRDVVKDSIAYFKL